VETIERPLAIACDGSYSDCALLAATRAGDHDALAMLYDRYWRLVFRVSNRMLADADAAEDVVQSVFLSMWSTPPAIGQGTLGAWLRVVTRKLTRAGALHGPPESSASAVA
jgi:RNA polymerase sigma-70 factor (ECF subfamily)